MSPSSTSSSDPSRTGALPDGAIALPQAPHPSGTWAQRALVLSVFTAALVGTGVVDSVRPEVRPKPLGRELELDNARRAASKWSDGSRTHLIEDDFTLASRVRAIVRPAYALALYELFNETGDSEVIAGRDGWLFFRSRTGMTMRETPRVALERSAQQFAALHRRLANLGMRAISVPLPRKEVVERERLPVWVDAREELDNSLVSAWRERGIETVDLLPLFENPPGEPIYFPQGSHWTYDACVVVAEEIARQSGMWRPPSERSSVLIEGPRLNRHYDALTRIGVAKADAEARVGLCANPVRRLGDRAGVIVESVNTLPMPALALAGTSFTAPAVLGAYLQHFVDQPLWCLAVGATDGISPLNAFLREHSEWPSTMVIETPNHILLDAGYRLSIGALLGAHPPRSELHALPVEVLLEPTYSGAGAVVPSSNARVAWIASGVLGQTGDGVVEIALSGEVSGGDVQVNIVAAGSAVNSIWRAGQREFVVPILATDGFSGAVAVTCRSPAAPARLSVASARAVVAADAAALVELQAGEPRREAQRWKRTFTPRENAVLPRHSTLWIQLGSGPTLARDVTLDLFVRDSSEPRSWSFPIVLANSPLVIGLGAIHGAEIERIELSATGSTLEIQHGRVLVPRRP
jgi:hypothetical protein